MSKEAHDVFMAEGCKAADSDHFDHSVDAMAPDEVVALPLLLEHLDILMELMADEYLPLPLIKGAEQLLASLIYFW